MFKPMIFACLLLTGLMVRATTVTFNSDATQADSAKASLSPVPQEILGILLDNGLKFKADSKNKSLYKVELKAVNCYYKHNGALDPMYPESGVPTNHCRYQSDTELGSKKGKLLIDGRALLDKVEKVLTTLGSDIEIMDCAMGKCAILIKSVTCEANTAIEEYQKGRFTCSITGY